MDRMEILRLALASAKDAREALTLAQEMAAFVGGEPPAAPQPAQPQPDLRALADAVIAKKAEERKVALHPLPSRANKAWTNAERERAAAMLDAGASYAATGKVLGRSARAIQAIRSEGGLPVKKHTMSDVRRLTGALGALAQGFKVDHAAFAPQPNGKAP